MFSYKLKGRLSQCRRRPFSLRLTAFWKVKDRLSQYRLSRMINSLTINPQTSHALPIDKVNVCIPPVKAYLMSRP